MQSMPQNMLIQGTTVVSLTVPCNDYHRHYYYCDNNWRETELQTGTKGKCVNEKGME